MYSHCTKKILTVKQLITYDATFFLARSKRLLDNQACDILWLDLQIFVLRKSTFSNVIYFPYSYSAIFELEVV